MRWMVGVDPRDLSAGAVALAQWMAKRATQDQFVGAHVLELELQELFARVNPNDASDGVPDYVDGLLDPLREDGSFVEVGTITATTAEDGLEAAAKERGCKALIIGRRKPTKGRALVRLGRVARRLLRTLQFPIIVVPPDAGGAEFSDGPVLIATALTKASEGAARFGKLLAERLNLDTLTTTVATGAEALTLYMPGELWAPAAESLTKDTHDRLQTWVAEHGLGSGRHSVVEGSVGPALLQVAETAGASMIVVGSRGLGTFDRMFVSSVGTELAAAAPIPVCVVPPTWEVAP